MPVKVGLVCWAMNPTTTPSPGMHLLLLLLCTIADSRFYFLLVSLSLQYILHRRDSKPSNYGMGTARSIADPGLKQTMGGRALSISPHTKAVSSVLVFGKENRSQDTEASGKRS